MTSSPDEPEADDHTKDNDPHRRAHRHMNIGLVMVAAAALGIAFWAGRATAPKTESAQSATCKEAVKAGNDLGAQAGTQQANNQLDAAATSLQTYATLVIQNPTCFNSTDRAASQQFLTQHALDQNSQDINRLREAQCAAAGKGWWC